LNLDYCQEKFEDTKG